jgi:hypothetical protein
MPNEIADTAESLVALYREAKSAYERSQIISHNVKSIKPSIVKQLVTHFYGNKVPTDHNDLKFLHKLLNFAVIQESGTLNEEQLKATQKHQNDVISKGPSSTAGDEDEDQPLTPEGEDMETQTEGKRKEKSKASSKAPERKKKVQETWYDKDTKFVATPDKTDYKPNSKGRPGIAFAALAKPVTMSRAIEKFVANMEESGLAKEQRITNLQSLADRWIPSYVKWLMDEKKAVKVFKEGDEESTKSESKKSGKKKRDAEASK